MRPVAVALAAVLLACSSGSTTRGGENATCKYFYDKVSPLISNIKNGDPTKAYDAAISQPAFTTDVTPEQTAIALRLAAAANRKDFAEFITAASDLGHAC
jgi:hypothetical protein